MATTLHPVTYLHKTGTRSVHKSQVGGSVLSSQFLGSRKNHFERSNVEKVKNIKSIVQSLYEFNNEGGFIENDDAYVDVSVLETCKDYIYQINFEICF